MVHKVDWTIHGEKILHPDVYMLNCNKVVKNWQKLLSISVIKINCIGGKKIHIHFWNMNYETRRWRSLIRDECMEETYNISV